MRLITVIDPEIQDERVEVYAKENYPQIPEIRKILNQPDEAFIGFLPDGSFKTLKPDMVSCFTIIGGKVMAKMGRGKDELLIKKRLYEIEEKLPPCFFRISQSCLINLDKIEKFELCYNGSIKCLFKNGYSEFVSRRFVKKLKERLGI